MQLDPLPVTERDHGADTYSMDITFHEPDTATDGRTRIEDATWGRWMILVETDGTCSIRDYSEQEWLPATYPTLDEAKAEVQRVYTMFLAEAGL